MTTDRDNGEELAIEESGLLARALARLRRPDLTPGPTLPDWRYGPPAEEYWVAWEYLLPNRPMTRRVDTLEAFTTRQLMRLMELDVNIPDLTAPRLGAIRKGGRCFIPAAFLTKPVAADFEVRDAAGTVVSVPTRQENMTLTERALAEISDFGAAALGGPTDRFRLDPETTAIANHLIRATPPHARICRMEIEKNMPAPTHFWLLPLLRRLEDHFILWIPLNGAPGSEHHLRIRRSDVRDMNSVFPPFRHRNQRFTVSTPVREIEAEWDPARRWLRKFSVPKALNRLLVVFGLMPVKLEDELVEADRFSSYHLRVVPPPGLLLREIRPGEISEAEWDEPQPKIDEISRSDMTTIQGRDSQMGHVHFSSPSKPKRLAYRVTIGLRSGTTTLWALVATLSCGLLWAYHRDIQSLGHHTASPLHGGHTHHFNINLAVAVAVLLVGPTFASAWTLRDRDRALMRNMLAGTRLVLLFTAILSVGTALALASMRPFHWQLGPAVQWYASAGYALAVLILVGWLQARGIVWSLYRNVLTSTKWNLLALIGLNLGAAVALFKLASSPALAIPALFVLGFAMSSVAGNRTSVVLGEISRLPAALAGVSAILTLALAGRELRFFNALADKGFAHLYGARAELVLAALAALVLLTRYTIRLRRAHKAQKTQETLSPAPATA